MLSLCTLITLATFPGRLFPISGIFLVSPQYIFIVNSGITSYLLGFSSMELRNNFLLIEKRTLKKDIFLEKACILVPTILKIHF